MRTKKLIITSTICLLFALIVVGIYFSFVPSILSVQSDINRSRKLQQELITVRIEVLRLALGISNGTAIIDRQLSDLERQLRYNSALSDESLKPVHDNFISQTEAVLEKIEVWRQDRSFNDAPHKSALSSLENVFETQGESFESMLSSYNDYYDASLQQVELFAVLAITLAWFIGLFVTGIFYKAFKRVQEVHAKTVRLLFRENRKSGVALVVKQELSRSVANSPPPTTRSSVVTDGLQATSAIIGTAPKSFGTDSINSSITTLSANNLNITTEQSKVENHTTKPIANNTVGITQTAAVGLTGQVAKTSITTNFRAEPSQQRLATGSATVNKNISQQTGGGVERVLATPQESYAMSVATTVSTKSVLNSSFGATEQELSQRVSDDQRDFMQTVSALLTAEQKYQLKQLLAQKDGKYDELERSFASLENEYSLQQTILTNLREKIENTVENLPQAEVPVQLTEKLDLHFAESTHIFSDTYTDIKYMDSAVSDIDELTQNIKEIGDRIKMLAMNAAIEAAHAGSYGKGFAVVAEEMGRLAEETLESSAEVQKTMTVLVNRIHHAREGGDSFDKALKTMAQDIAHVQSEMRTTTDRISSSKKTLINSIES